METTTAPEGPGADAPAARAKRSLDSHLDEIGRRVKSARNKVDLRAQIVAHPWPALGLAFALGAFAAVAVRRSARAMQDNPIRGALTAGAGAIAIQLLKGYALGQLADAARSWLDERLGGAPRGEPRAS